MRNYYKNQAQRISAALRICLTILLSVLLTLTASEGSFAQCTTGCTSTVTTNVAITINSGQTVCLKYNGTYNKTITFNGTGGTLCIGSTTTWNTATLSFSGSSATINNYGKTNKTFTLPNGYTLNNYGNITGGTLTQSSGSTVTNSGSFAGVLTQNGGSFNNDASGVVSNSVTIKGTFTNDGSMTNGVTISTSGQLINNGLISSTLILSTATSELDNYGSITGAFTQTNGTSINYSGGVFSPSATTFTAGTLDNNAGGTATLGAITVKNGFTLSNYGDMTATAVTNNAGGTINFAGTAQTVTGNFSNQSTVTLNGTLTITGTYTDGILAVPSTIQAVGAGTNCNILQIGTVANGFCVGTFDGNNIGMTLTGATPTTTTRMINGATGPVSAPIVQGSGSSLSASALTVSGSFTAPAGANGYLVLRYIGASAPSDNPSDNTLYAVGNAVGSSTVAAILDGATGTRNFTDNLPSSACGQTVYYSIFSFNGNQPCEIFDLSSPLTDNITMAVPTPSITAGGPTTFCSGDNVTLTAAGGNSYLWSTTSTSGSITASSAGTYTVTATAMNGCTASVNQVVTVNSAAAITPYVNINGTGWTINASPSVCAGGLLEFGPQPIGGTWSFTGPSGFTSFQRDTMITNMQIAQTGTYVATFIDPGNGCSATQNFVVTVNALPTPTANNATICAGQSATLTATGGVSYLWSTGATSASINPSPGSTTAYSVTATNADGCTASTRDTVTVNSIPSVGITAGGPTTFCAGGSVTLTGTGGTSYVWSTGATTTAISVNTSGTYRVTATNAAGCTASASVAVTVKTLPLASSTNAVSCFSAPSTITASGGGTYVWSTGATTASITQSPDSTTTYTVTVTNVAGCTASASGTITVSKPSPATTNPAVCAGTTATMTASGGTSYIWSTGSTTDTIRSLTSGVYSVTATNALGCSATASGIITVNPLPAPTIDSPFICAGNVATINATGGVLYAWSSGQSTASITTVSAGTYTVTVTNFASCTASISTVVTAASLPIASATNGVICSGNPAVITASGGGTYVWSTGAVSASISVASSGTYRVTATNSSGCSASASSTVTTASTPTPSISPATSSICLGGSATLTASGGVSYLWSTGATTAAITVSPAATTTYSVTVTNAGGCTASTSRTVTVNALPTPAVTNGTVCTGTPTTAATMTATGGISYVWSTGSTTDTIRTLTVGTYRVTATNASGCTASVSGTVGTAAKPTPTVNSPSGCNGISATLTATGGTSYLWSTTATTTSIVVSPSTTTAYTVTATNAAGCTASVTSNVTIYPLPTVAPGSNTPILLNATINLTSNAAAGTSPYTYTWSGPSSFSSTTANPNVASAGPGNGGIYYVTVTDNHSCTVRGNTTVILNYAAPGGLGSNTALWLDANTGVTQSAGNVTAWADQSQLNNHVTTVNGTNPTLVTNSINSFPVVSFGGAGGLQGSFGTAITSTSASAFIVTKVATASTNPSGIFSIAASASIDSTSTNNAIFFTRGTNSLATIRNSATLGNYANASALGQYHLATSIISSTAGKDSFFVEGRAATTATVASSALNSTRYSIGSRLAAATAGRYLNGQIAEVALFNRQVTNAERAQVESYLAVKYGLTLNQTTAQNYVASNGVVYWSASANGTYKNNIFGVGKDNVSNLNMTQSVSINTNLLSINSASGLGFYSYLMFSDNNAGNTVAAAAGLPNNINAKLATVWRTSQTGVRTSANFVFNTSSTSFGYYAPIASSMTPFMLIDSDANGTYETYIAATSVVGSNITFNANLKDGALFTCGFKASIDYGDAFYVPTTAAAGGAAHMIAPGGVYLGSLVDAEFDGVPSVNAMGDDTIGVADEDGVNFNIGVPTTFNIVQMGSNSIQVTASGPGYLNAWADFNQDQSYGGGSEYAIQNVHLVAGVNTVTFNVSDSVQYGPTSMRFRFAAGNSDVTGPNGLVTNGEVEDYEIYVTAPLVGACTNGFQNPGYELGPAPGSYTITNDYNLPYWRTNAADKMIEMWKSGFNGVSAHGGTYFIELEANLYGSMYQDVYTTPGTKLQWSFAHRGRSGSDTAELRIGPPNATAFQNTAIDGTSGWGVHSGFYTVPAGQYITRLEFVAVGSYGGNNSIGNFLDDVSVGSSFDYGDAPNSYGTTFAASGPYHSISGALYLGSGESCDGDGVPDANASSDLQDDGVTFPSICANCNTVSVAISSYNVTGSPATIAGWIDFNKNGVFEASERKSIRIPSGGARVDTLKFTVTAFTAISPNTFSRFRIANDSTEIATPYGLATSGEVEDYKVPCVGLPTPVPTATPTPVCARGPMTLSATGSAPFYSWTGPNGFSASTQNPSVSSVGAADSGLYRVYAVYANGCATDSAVRVSITNCFVNLSGKLLDDANGNGLKDGVEITSNRGQTVYAVLSDNTNTVLDKSLAAADGSFSFTSVPAYTTGMTIIPSTVNPTIGAGSPGPSWPANWVGTKEQYGANNTAGTGVYNTPNLVPVSVVKTDVTGLYLGYDQLPTSTVKNYTIPHPAMNSAKSIIAANGLGMFAGSDPEDGTFTAGNTFTMTSLTGINGNKLFYDANGDGTLQAYEEIIGYTVITNVDPTKFFIKFTGFASSNLSFNYATKDAAGQVDPAPASYNITWTQALPVKLVSFTADKYNETQSQLKWATSSEINNDHFDIERSADGLAWSKIGEVKGAGNSNETMEYSYTDEATMTGANYYRLKQVDFDGKFEYSNIAEVDFDGGRPLNTTVMSIYPNPLSAGKGLNIALKESDDNIKNIIITNEVGQVVYKTDVQETQGYEIQGLDLPAGIYMVNVQSQSNATFSGKIIVTR